MNILILGLNYAPEPVGIGPYTTGMATELAASGHRVVVVCGHPYYPDWKIQPGFEGKSYRSTIENGVEVIRCPIYVPANPTGTKRLIHHISFAAMALPPLLAKARGFKPEIVMAIAPSMISAPIARVAAKMSGAKFWLHIQDFEVEAALATDLIRNGSWLAKAARAFESLNLGADRVSTISPQMCAKLLQKGVPADRIFEFRNWADIDAIRPLGDHSSYRTDWDIDRPHVALYSGNIANKQGIEIIVNAAELLAHRKDLLFIVCGNGANRERLIASAAHLDNIRFFDLQPIERLSDLLGLASVHLLPQIGSAADLVLPSKLTNILASGRPVVATACAGTGLSSEIDGCGLLVEPGDAFAFSAAIERLLDDPPLHEIYGRQARHRAEERWSKHRILERFQAELQTCAGHMLAPDENLAFNAAALSPTNPAIESLAALNSANAGVIR